MKESIENIKSKLKETGFKITPQRRAILEILLENDDGKLLITKETLTSIVNSVVSGFESVKDQQSKIILDENNNLSILLTIEVSDNAVIKELTL